MILPSFVSGAITSGHRPLPRTIMLDGPDDNTAFKAVSRLLGIQSLEPVSEFRISWRQATQAPQPGADEAYTLLVEPGGISLDAETLQGVLHGLATLAQLRRDDTLACASIHDKPKHGWRGLMLDPARRFLPITHLETVIDGMAMLKLNVLHLHLTDDQGFRFESKVHPHLPSAEHYSQVELKRLVAFAADRGVRIVPELDMPGHVTSWLKVYPEWGNRPVSASTRFGVHPGCLNAADDAVYQAIDALLAEVCDVFPDPCVHLGGDEVHSSWWKDDPAVQSFMAEQELADTQALQAYFMRRVAAMLTRRGKTVLGWDEVLHPDLPTHVIVQSWRGATARDRALAAGHDCIVSSGYYLDLFYPGAVHRRYRPDADEAILLAQEDELLSDARFAHVADGMKWTHAWRLVPPVPRAAKRGRILGGEACLWGELVDQEVLDGRLWSRLADVAECFWAQTPLDDDRVLSERWPVAVVAGLARNRERLANVAGDPALLEVLELCEPVKWYARLLGEVALNARIRGTEMPQARPYSTETRLNRAVDFLTPESFVCRDVATWSVDEITAACQRWAHADGLNQVPDDVRAVLAAIATSARAWLDCQAGDLSVHEAQAILRDVYRPHGEYLPAVAPVLARRLG